VSVYVHLCAGSRPTALLHIGAYETRALDERRVERFTVCARESRLNHSSTAGCNSSATETADNAAKLRLLSYACTHTHTHTHTHMIALFVYATSRIGCVQLNAATDRTQICDPTLRWLSCSGVAIMAQSQR